MAVATIRHSPALTKEQLETLFREHFSGKYLVERHRGLLRDFQVVKNPFIGVSVKLKQGSNETKIIYTGFVPRLWARFVLPVFSDLLGFLLWNGLTNEVKRYIETAPELK